MLNLEFDARALYIEFVKVTLVLEQVSVRALQLSSVLIFL